MFKAILIPTNGRRSLILSPEKNAERMLNRAIGYVMLSRDLGDVVEVAIVRTSDNFTVRNVICTHQGVQR